MSESAGKLILVADMGLGDDEAEVAASRGWSVVMLRTQGDDIEPRLHEAMRQHEGVAVHLAIADNARRRALGLEAVRMGHELATLIHRRTWLSPTARIDAGVAIGAGTVVTGLAHLGMGARIGCGVLIEHHNVIGAWARLDAGVALAGRVTVGEGATLRECVSVRQGIRIGAGATVGMRAAVVRNVAAGVVVGGVPAREAHA